MKKNQFAAIAFTLSLLLPVSAQAITYKVTSDAIVSTMEGTFTIDDIGTINSAAQILDYRLELGDVNSADIITLTPANSTIDIRGDYSMIATGTELFMNIGFGGRFVIDTPFFSWEYRSIAGGSPIHRIEGTNFGFRDVTPGTTELLGTALAPTPVPLPPALALMVTGLGMLGVCAMRRKRITAS